MPTVKEAFERARQVGISNRLAPRTLRVLQEAAEAFAKVYGADTALPVDLVPFKVAHAAKMPNTLNKYLRQYARVCKLAGLTVKVEMLKVPRKRPDVLTDEEVQRLFAAAGRMYPLILFVAAIGCRRSEACALEWSQVSLSRKEVTLIDAKSKSERVVPLPDAVIKELKTLPRGRYVFRALRRIDRPFNFNGLTNAISQVFKRAGLAKKQRGLHCLRRTFATRAAMAGVPMPTLMAIGGWSRIETVSSYYIAVSEESKRAAIEKLNG